MKNTKKIQKAHEFFCNSEKEDIKFSLDDIANETGWALSTVDGYRTKKWNNFLIEEEHNRFRCKNILDFPLKAFIKIHEQRVEIHPDQYRPDFNDVTDILIDKSRESVMLAIQIYNNPTIKFKSEGFIVFMVIAFTTLFHAIFQRKDQYYWYMDEEGNPRIVDGDKKYWELSTCITKYYQDKQTPEKQNLYLCISIRNKIEHRYYEAVDFDLSGYCQALLLNYEDLLVTEFGKYFSLGGNQLSLALQISSYNSSIEKVKNVIQKQNYEEIMQFIQDFRQNLPLTIIESDRFCFRAFLIPRIGNHKNSSDVAIEWVNYDPENPVEMENLNKMACLIKEKRVQVANQGRYLPSVVVKQLENRGIFINIQTHTKAWKFYKVRTSDHSPKGCNSKYCQFSEPHKNFIYTAEWVDFLAQQLSDKEEFAKIQNFKTKESTPHLNI
jgi:hypothetical protein